SPASNHTPRHSGQRSTRIPWCSSVFKSAPHWGHFMKWLRRAPSRAARAAASRLALGISASRRAKYSSSFLLGLSVIASPTARRHARAPDLPHLIPRHPRRDGAGVNRGPRLVGRGLGWGLGGRWGRLRGNLRGRVGLGCLSRRPNRRRARAGPRLLLTNERNLIPRDLVAGGEAGNEKQDSCQCAPFHRVPPSGSRARLIMDSNTLAPSASPSRGSVAR